MKKYLALTLLIATIPTWSFYSKIENLSPEFVAKMQGNSWKADCPVNVQDLHHVYVNYVDFEGKTQVGEIVIHKKLSKEVVEIFQELFEAKFPIQSMKPYSDFAPGEYGTKNNTVGFYCRPMQENHPSLSNHSYGIAIDLNPFINPFSGHKVWPDGAQAYLKREITTKGLIHPSSAAFKAFTKHGWQWGGFYDKPDYMHFLKLYGKHYVIDAMRYIEDKDKINGLEASVD